jgi:hypothetical protein
MHSKRPIRRSAALAAAVAAFALTSTTLLAQERVSLINLEGRPLPGSTSPVDIVNTPYVSGNGSVGFTGGLVDGSRFVYFDTSIIFFNSDETSVALVGGEATMGVTDSGGFVISPSIDGADGIYSHIGVLARGTEPTPGITGRFHTFGSRPRMSANGTAWWVGGTATTSGGTNTMDVLWSATTSGGTPSYSARLKGGDLVQGIAVENTGLGFDYDVSDNASHFLIEADMATGSTTNDAAIVLNGTSIIAQEGSPLGDGSGNNWQGLRSVGINNDGDWIVYGDDNGSTTTDDVLMFNGAVVARQGQTMGGVTLGATIDAASINNLGQIAQIWDIAGATGDEGLFFGHSDDVSASQLLLRVGDQLDTDGDGTADFSLVDFQSSTTITYPLDLGDDGWIYVEVDLMDLSTQTELEAIIGFNTIPEPASLSLVGAAGLLLLRRRTRTP